MKNTETLLTPEDQLTLQNAFEWLSRNYSPATRGIHMQTSIERNGSDSSALLTLTVQSILYGWSKQADIVINTKSPLKKVVVYTKLETALLAALAKKAD